MQKFTNKSPSKPSSEEKSGSTEAPLKTLELAHIKPEDKDQLLSGKAVVLFHTAPGCAVEIHAYIVADASLECVWNLLTDYENLPKVVPDMAECTLLGTQNGDRILRQAARVSDGLNLSMSVTLAVKEEPPNRIFFRSIDGDLKRFEGSWHLMPINQSRVLMAYEVLVQPLFWIPCWAVKHRLRKEIPRLMHALADEAARRNGKPGKS
jgi:ribosome-associated toxin RatA of RatAB toxin-antitoxin module